SPGWGRCGSGTRTARLSSPLAPPARPWPPGAGRGRFSVGPRPPGGNSAASPARRPRGRPRPPRPPANSRRRPAPRGGCGGGEAATGKELHRLRAQEDPLFAVAFAPDGKTLASGGEDGVLRLFDPASGKEVRQVNGLGTLAALTFSPDGNVLASGGADGMVRL